MSCLQKESYRGVTSNGQSFKCVALIPKRNKTEKIAKTYVRQCEDRVRCIKGVIILPTPRVIIAGVIKKGLLSEQGSLYDTNPNNSKNALNPKGNPSKLLYICIKFDPPKV